MSSEGDTANVRNIFVKILKSPNDSFKITMMRMACGQNRRTADTLARLIQFNTFQKDSLIILDRGIAINKTDKFRNQQIVLTVYVPVGKQIRIDKSTGWGHDVHFGINNNNNIDVDIDDEERGWDQNVNYVMRANGLYTLNGKPADDWKNRNRNDENDNEEENNINEPKKSTTDGKGYRYNNSTPKIDSLKMNLQKEQQQYKDSLLKEQNEIKRKQEENQQKLEKINVITQVPETNDSHILQSYSPVACIGLI